MTEIQGENATLAELWTMLFNDSRRFNIEEFESYLKEKLQNGILVDLGGGDEQGHRIRELASKAGVRDYVNVDKLFDKTPSLTEPAEEYAPTEYSIGGIGVNADILDFVGHTQDASANFVINGIDGTIIEDYGYSQELARQLLRATKRNGLIFGVGSDVLDILEQLRKEGKANIRKYDMPYPYYCFEKLG